MDGSWQVYWGSNLKSGNFFKKKDTRDTSGTKDTSGPMVNTLPSNAGGVVLIPGPGTKIPHAMWYSQKK